MADENKINDMEELDLEELENAAGGIEFSNDLAGVKTKVSPFLDGLKEKYGVSTYKEAMRRMTKEEQLQYIQERKKMNGWT